MEKCPKCCGTGWQEYGSETETGTYRRRCTCIDGVIKLFEPGPVEPRTIDGRVVFVDKEAE